MRPWGLTARRGQAKVLSVPMPRSLCTQTQINLHRSLLHKPSDTPRSCHSDRCKNVRRPFDLSSKAVDHHTNVECRPHKRKYRQNLVAHRFRDCGLARTVCPPSGDVGLLDVEEIFLSVLDAPED